MMQILEETDLCFEKWHKEFGDFWPNTQKSQKLHFHELILTKVYDFWDKKNTEELKLKSDTVSWHWRVMHYLKKN